MQTRRKPRATGPNLHMIFPLASQPRQGPQPPQYVRGVLVEDYAHHMALLAAEREGEQAGWAYREAARASAHQERLAHIQRWLAAGGTHHSFVMAFVVDYAPRKGSIVYL